MLGVLEKLAIMSWCVAINLSCATVVIALLPFSPLHNSISIIEKEKLTTITPQGWGFFTKDPQEERLHIYKLTPDGKWEANDIANASIVNYLGASRKSRLRGLEIAELLGDKTDFNSTIWEECESHDQVKCLENLTNDNILELENEYPLKTICGKIALLQQKPNPWVYKRAGFENGNDVKYLYLRVNCR